MIMVSLEKISDIQFQPTIDSYQGIHSDQPGINNR